MMRRAMCAGVVLVVVVGCGGDARVDLSAADGIRAAAQQVELTLREYHQEVSKFDDSRETNVVSAFITRVRRDNQDEAAVDSHAAAFQAALAKIRGDRDVEYERQVAARENVSVLREMAAGLERLGIESLSLQDEMKRYLTSWMDARRRAGTAAQQQEGGTP